VEQIIVKVFWMIVSAFLAWTGLILRGIWSEQKAQGVRINSITTQVAIVESDVLHIKEKVSKNEANILGHEDRLDKHDLAIQANKLS